MRPTKATMQDIIDRIDSGFTFIRQRLREWRPSVCMILGSGFSEWTDSLNQYFNIPYDQIPGFPTTSVPGHAGRLVLVDIDGHPVLLMQGRCHYYEGYSMPVLSIPVRIFKKLGIETLILTNASGSVNPLYQPGDLMIIRDHINLVQNNPLIGPNVDEYGTRFPDASAIFTEDLRELGLQTARDLQLRAHSGVYVYTSGPAFETPAEIRMMQIIGADAVGMSTVPEAITACHAGLKVMGISLVANLGCGMAQHPLTHEDVMQTVERVAPDLHRFLGILVRKILGNGHH